MAYVGTKRFIYFRLLDINSNPVTGRVQSQFSIIFTRNNTESPDTLTVTEIGAGRYFASYTPSTTGTDYVEIYDAATSIRAEDVEVIELSLTQILEDTGIAGNVVVVNQDYGGAGVLRPSVSNLSTYVLYAFLSSNWSIGNTNPAYAVASYQMDSTGNWSFSLASNTYNLVLINDAGSVIVFKFNLIV